jgi:D-inositol-3-phosphate glycosyltransferase
MHVLTVARWYPSHDVRFRGVFVADLVTALRGIGIDVSVASWEAALVRGDQLGEAQIAWVEAAWRGAVQGPDASNVPVSWGAGVPVARLPEVDDGRRAGWRDRVRAHTAQLLPFVDGLHFRHPVDLVHAHGGIPDGLVAAAIADQLGVPLVVTEHATSAPRSLAGDPGLAEAYRQLLDAPRRLVAVSEETALEVAGALGVAPERIGVIGNVVDVAAFPPVGLGSRDQDELLWVGERSEKKGIDVLYGAIALLAADRPNLRLRLIGRAPSGEIEARWASLAASLGIADRLRVEGPAGRAGVAAAMARAAVFVHAGPLETFGVVAAEAIASGLPVAARPSPGLSSVVGRDRTLGTMADGHDPADLARAVEDVLARRADFDPDAMHRSIDERFNGRAVARQYQRLYDELLAERTRGTPPSSAASGAGWAGHGFAALVVGTQRTLLERRVAQLPWSDAAGITIVSLPARTAGAAARGDARGGADDPVAAGRPLAVEELDPDAPYQRELARLAGPSLARLPAWLARPARAALRPGAALGRRRLRRRRAEWRRQELERLVRDAWRRRSGDGPAAWIVALDPVDVLAARAALDSGAPLAPGGLRWLADRIDERGRGSASGA